MNKIHRIKLGATSSAILRSTGRRWFAVCGLDDEGDRATLYLAEWPSDRAQAAAMFLMGQHEQTKP